MFDVSHRSEAMFDRRVEPVADLGEYAGIPSVFESRSVYVVTPMSGRVELVEHPLSAPFRKDYDEAESPHGWPSELHRTESVLLSMFSGGGRVGGAIVAVAVPRLLTWLDEPGAAILWDLRVRPMHRRKGVASSLLGAAEVWARERGCAALCVETQNTNVGACKFYMHNGFDLQHVQYNAYPQVPDEVQLIWRKSLGG